MSITEVCVLGLDPSITSYGWALVKVDADGNRTVGAGRIRTKSSEPLSTRARRISDTLADLVETHQPDLVAREGIVTGGKRSAASVVAQGVYLLSHLACAGRPMVEISPSVVKRCATGKGKAEKEEMISAAVRWLGVDHLNPDEADAVWLAVAGTIILGRDVIDLPPAHRIGLSAMLDDIAVA